MSCALCQRVSDRLGSAEAAAIKRKFSLDYCVLTEFSLDLVCVVEVSGYNHQYLYASPSSLETLGWTPEEIYQLTPDKIYTKESLAVIAADIDKIRAGKPTSTVVIEAVRKDGHNIWLENKVRVLDARENGDMTVMVCMRDVTERKFLQDQLAQMAFVDSLTGIDNRRAFDRRIDEEWRRSWRSGSPLSLVLMDVDHFKLFNDSYGHRVGDEALRAIATCMRKTLRRAGDSIARYGGEEFAAILPSTDLAGAEKVANDLRLGICGLHIPHGANAEGGGFVSLSAGVSCAIAHNGKITGMPEGLILSADSALYKAKLGGRNRVANSPIRTRGEIGDLLGMSAESRA